MNVLLQLDSPSNILRLVLGVSLILNAYLLFSPVKVLVFVGNLPPSPGSSQSESADLVALGTGAEIAIPNIVAQFPSFDAPPNPEAFPYPFEGYAKGEKFLAISPYGGLNNQLDHLYYQIGWARALGRTLVLPPFSSSHHTFDRGMYQIDFFLDIYQLSKIVKLISWEDFITLCNKRVQAVVGLEKIRKQVDIYRTFEVLEMANTTWDREAVIHIVEPFGSEMLRKSFRETGLDSARCVLVSGISKFDDYDRRDFSEESLYFKVRKAVRFASYINHAASSWVRRHMQGTPFLAVHFRRGDFRDYCTSKDIAIYPYVHQAVLLSGESIRKLSTTVTERPGCFPDTQEAVQKIIHVAQKCNVSNIFLSTNADPSELDAITSSLGPQYRLFRYTGGGDFVPNVPSTVDIAINTLGDCFLGNKYSSFSFTIMTKRRQLAHQRAWDTSFLF